MNKDRMNLITKPDKSRRRIAAVGMYDGVHLGHRFLLGFLREEACRRSLQPVAVTFSRHPLALVRPLEEPPLLSTLEERVNMLPEAGAEAVILLSFNSKLRTLSAREFLKLLHEKFAIDALVLGFNNRIGHDGPLDMEQYRDIGREVKVEVVAAPEFRGLGTRVSSSAIRRLLMDGEPGKAAVMLGHNYTLRGRVVDGNHLGRTLGFATANIVPAEPKSLIPRTGAYAAWVTTPDGERRPAMVNIGYRPTVTHHSEEHEYGSDYSRQAERPGIEAHIFDFCGYIYDEEITVEFVSYMRPEQRFATTDKLKARLTDDAAAARRILNERSKSNGQ